MSAVPVLVRSSFFNDSATTQIYPLAQHDAVPIYFGSWNVPSPLLSAVHTPSSPNPTMSAFPVPVRSARKRGCFSTRDRKSVEQGKTVALGGRRNIPKQLLSAVHTPSSPNPTMSAFPVPVRSARKRGCFSPRHTPHV